MEFTFSWGWESHNQTYSTLDGDKLISAMDQLTRKGV